MLLLLIFAFLAGIATILSPCIIPILPAVLSGGLNSGKLRPLGIILGLVASFSFFTLTLTVIVHATGISPDVLRYVAIVSIAILGATMIFPALSDAFEKLTAFTVVAGSRLQTKKVTSNNSGFFGGAVLGISLGLLWTPCAGPILASITSLALTGHLNLLAVLLTVSYSFGAGIPLLLIAYGGNRALTSSKFFASKANLIRKIFGIIMILTALSMLFNLDRTFQSFALQYLPSIQPDTNLKVSEALKGLKNSNGTIANSIQGKPLSQTAVLDQTGAVLPDLGVAPELTGLSGWINSQPLTLSSLRGKVVLVDFWTYSCINCIRTLPYVNNWYNTYKDHDLVILGIHTPEFEFEKINTNVVDAVNRFQIHYPVAQDNNYGTWNAFGNQYWPADYLIDKQGHLRGTHFGEGDYAKTENEIRSLLGMDPVIKTDTTNAQHASTPETYLGYARAGSYTGSMQSIVNDQNFVYTFAQPLAMNEVGLNGNFNVHQEYIESVSDLSKLVIHFQAGKVHLVLGGTSPTPVGVNLDGKPIALQFKSSDYNSKGELVINGDREYTIVDLQNLVGNYTLEITLPKSIQAYAFTFSP